MISDIFKEKQKIDFIFKLTEQIPYDEELLSHWAKYLCVITSGFIESSIRLIFIQFAKNKACPEVCNFIESRIKGITNLNKDKILQLLGSFNPMWRDLFERQITSKQKDVIDSVISNRHQIVHGRSIGLTLNRIREYYSEIVNVITFIDEGCVNKQ